MKRFWLLIISTSLSLIGYSQEYSERFQDAELWTQIGINKTFTKKIEAAASLAYRTDNNYAEFRSAFFQLDGSYELTKALKVGVGYRQSLDGDMDRDHRLMLKSRYKYRIKPFDLMARIRYDHKFGSKTSSLEQVFRSRFLVRYKKKKKKYRPFVFIESFYTLRYDFNDFDNVRIGIGSDLMITKDLTVGIAYLLQSEFNQARPTDRHILSLELAYQID